MDGYLGTIMLWAGNFAPQNWAYCQGQLLQVSQYSALYSILGTTYGGDGRTTFGLPDLRGRVPVGTGPGPGLTNYPPGTKYGVETTTLNLSQMPQHIHDNTVSAQASPLSVSVAIPSVTGSEASTFRPSNTALLGRPQGTPIYSSAAADTTLEPFDATGTLTPQVAINNAVAGGSSPVDIRQPFLALNFIICINGLYPARN